MVVLVSRLETLEAMYVNSCAIQTCKKLNEIFNQRCCGCKVSWENRDCSMLTQSEKIDLYFEESFRYVDMAEVQVIVKNCVSALIPKKKDQDRFWQRLPLDPRKNEVWKRKIRENLISIMNF